MDNLTNVLPEPVGSHQVVGVDGEFWSPHKLLRRATWHKRGHTAHILGLRATSDDGSALA